MIVCIRRTNIFFIRKLEKFEFFFLILNSEKNYLPKHDDYLIFDSKIDDKNLGFKFQWKFQFQFFVSLIFLRFSDCARHAFEYLNE